MPWNNDKHNENDNDDETKARAITITTTTVTTATTSVAVKKPNEFDVLCGRGALVNDHPGNKLYRRMVMENKKLYQSCERHFKALLAQSILIVFEKNLKGRFLKYCESKDCWYDIGFQEALKKTCQALREGSKEVRHALELEKRFQSQLQQSHELLRHSNKASSSALSSTTTVTSTTVPTTTISRVLPSKDLQSPPPPSPPPPLTVTNPTAATRVDDVVSNEATLQEEYLEGYGQEIVSPSLRQQQELPPPAKKPRIMIPPEGEESIDDIWSDDEPLPLYIKAAASTKSSDNNYDTYCREAVSTTMPHSLEGQSTARRTLVTTSREQQHHQKHYFQPQQEHPTFHQEVQKVQKEIDIFQPLPFKSKSTTTATELLRSNFHCQDTGSSCRLDNDSYNNNNNNNHHHLDDNVPQPNNLHETVLHNKITNYSGKNIHIIEPCQESMTATISINTPTNDNDDHYPAVATISQLEDSFLASIQSKLSSSSNFSSSSSSN